MPRSNYKEIKTDFVRRELRRTPWSKRGYIDTLMTVERICADGGLP